VALLERKSEVWHRLGDLDYQTDKPTANKAYQNAVAIRERLAASLPMEPRFRMALSRSYNGIAITVGSDNEQLAAYRRSLELRLALANEIPEDPDLLHGLNESFLNLGVQLWTHQHRNEGLELVLHSIAYGRAAVARRSHDLEFALDLGASYDRSSNFLWQLGRREEAIAKLSEGVEYYRKMSADNPDIRDYRDSLANALSTKAQYFRESDRPVESASLFREAAEVLETKPDPDAGALASAYFFRTRAAALLAGESASAEISSWPETARREAELSVADLKGAVARGYRRADHVRSNPDAKSLLARDDMRSLLAEMERPLTEPSRSTVVAVLAAAPSPLETPGRLENDQLLGAVTIGLLENNTARFGRTARDHLEAMLAKIESHQRAAANTLPLQASTHSIRVKLGELLWRDGELEKARRLWNEALGNSRIPTAEAKTRPKLLAAIIPSADRVVDAWIERGLWEQAAAFNDRYRAGLLEDRPDRCYDLALLAMASGDFARYREVAAESVALAQVGRTAALFNPLRAATLSPHCAIPPKALVSLASKLFESEKSNGWFRAVLGNALLRAGRYNEALEAIGSDTNSIFGRPVIALIHAKAGESDLARRCLKAVERDLEEHVGSALHSYGALLAPLYWPLDVLRADLLRREAYESLGETAPELRSLRLMRADALWRLNERDLAERELAAALEGAPDRVAALIARSRTFESLALADRADSDLALAIKQSAADPRPWVMRGKLLAERGSNGAADKAYARAAQLAPDKLDPFIESGWWVSPATADQEIVALAPDETQPDPTTSLVSQDGNPSAWKHVMVNQDRYAYLAPFTRDGQSSIRAFLHLFSDRDRTVLFCASGGERLRIWLNGRAVFDSRLRPTYRAGPGFLAPASLRTGRNTLFVIVGQSRGGHELRLRTDDFELDRAYLNAEFGRWAESAELMDRAANLGQIRQPWEAARNAELLAALGDDDRYLRGARSLIDGTLPGRASPYNVALALGIRPNNLVNRDRLIEIALKEVEEVAAEPSLNWRYKPLAVAYYRAGRYREALDVTLKRLSSDDPHKATIEALAHWKLGQKDEARKALAFSDDRFAAWCRDRASGRGTPWLNWWFEGPSLFQLRREAYELIEGRHSNDKAAVESVRIAMGDLIDDRDSPTWAFDMALRLEPTSAYFKLALAGRQLELGRVAEAEPQLRAMIDGKTLEPRAWIERGMFFANAGQPDRAAADFGKALELVPGDLHVFGNCAAFCNEMAKQPAAFDKLLAERSSDPLLWYVRASLHLAHGATNDAVTDFRRGGEPPASSEFAYLYAGALLLIGDVSNYERYVSEQGALHGSSNVPLTLYILTRMAMLAEKPPVAPERVLAWATQARKTGEKFAWFPHAQGIAALRADKFAIAKQAIEDADRLPWGQTIVLNQVARALIDIHEGRLDIARARFENARAVLDTTPTFESESDRFHVNDWLEFQVLRREIERALYDRGFPDDPFVR
jgi:Tfp pilus assembly protein PilF